MAVAVKICGVRTPAAALVAATAGADLIGLNFAPSKRRITVSQAQAIVSALRNEAIGASVTVVGLFVDEQPEQVATIAAAVGLDWVQLSGYEQFDRYGELVLPVLKAVRLNGAAYEQAWLTQTPHCDVMPVLIDAHVAGSYGGTGVLADWTAATELAQSRPVLLAGGLTPDNVAQAVRTVHPWGVDVSSGVETDGAQDHAKIRAFVQAAKKELI